MAEWTNKFVETYLTPKDLAPKGRPRKWMPT